MQASISTCGYWLRRLINRSPGSRPTRSPVIVVRSRKRTSTSVFARRVASASGPGRGGDTVTSWLASFGTTGGHAACRNSRGGWRSSSSLQSSSRRRAREHAHKVARPSESSRPRYACRACVATLNHLAPRATTTSTISNLMSENARRCQITVAPISAGAARRERFVRRLPVDEIGRQLAVGEVEVDGLDDPKAPGSRASGSATGSLCAGPIGASAPALRQQGEAIRHAQNFDGEPARRSGTCL